MAKPFLKWSGGKRQLLPELLARVPAKYGAYHEPFVGGGALFFALNPAVAHLGDLNEELISTYRAIQDNVEDLISELKDGGYDNTAEMFAEIRAFVPIDEMEIAARMIYLNKTCFNGLHRVNKKGKFNSPYGRYANPTICDEVNLRACATALHANEQLHHEHFSAVESRAVPGDFCYFDSPYAPLTTTANFTAYTAGGFGPEDQAELRDMALRMKRKGVHVLLSNSSAPLVEELYGADFTLEPVAARRSINVNGQGRGAIREYLIS
jgi:DNA adenine methylase